MCFDLDKISDWLFPMPPKFDFSKLIALFKRQKQEPPKYKKISLPHSEQLQLLVILQNEEKKTVDYSMILINIGLTMSIIALTIFLLLQGALGQALLFKPTTNSTTNTIISNTMTSNTIAPTQNNNNLIAHNILFSFQGVLYVMLFLMALFLASQIISAFYVRRVKALRTYFLSRYKLDQDIIDAMMHITKDIK